MCRRVIWGFSAHSSSVPLMYSGPLSTRMVPGLPRHSMIRFKYEQGQTFAVEIIQQVQLPECPTIPEAIRHEVHRPSHVRRIRHRKGIGFVPLQPLARFDPQVQRESAEDATDPFVV